MIFVGADHRGYRLKERIKRELGAAGVELEDVGAKKYQADDDYPDVAISLGEKVAEQGSRGILICGSGVGMCFAVNKVKKIRAGIGFDRRQVTKAVRDDGMNVICLSADWIDDEKNLNLVKSFLEAEFDSQEKRLRRIRKVEKYESGKR